MRIKYYSRLLPQWVWNLCNKVKQKNRRLIWVKESTILFDLLWVNLFIRLCWLVCSLCHVLSTWDSLSKTEHAIRLWDVLLTCFSPWTNSLKTCHTLQFLQHDKIISKASCGLGFQRVRHRYLYILNFWSSTKFCDWLLIFADWS